MVFVHEPRTGLRFRVGLRVIVVDARNFRQPLHDAFFFDVAVAFDDHVRQFAEEFRKRELDALRFFFVVRRSAQEVAADRGVHGFHNFETDHDAHVVISGADLGSGRVESHGTGSAGRFVTRARHAVKRGMHFGQERAEVALVRVLLRVEVADEYADPVFFIQTDNFVIVETDREQAVFDDLTEHRNEGFAFFGPVALEIGLSAAQNVWLITHDSLSSCPFIDAIAPRTSRETSRIAGRVRV